MDQEINAGYTITDCLTVGDAKFVIGQRDGAHAEFVTWKCKKDEKEYFWGHYMSDRLTALEDLCNRALDEIHHLKSLQRELNPDEESVRRIQKNKHKPER